MLGWIMLRLVVMNAIVMVSDKNAVMMVGIERPVGLEMVIVIVMAVLEGMVVMMVTGKYHLL